MNENDITQRIIGCAIEVHKALGPGLLESAYEECLFFELQAAGRRRMVHSVGINKFAGTFFTVKCYNCLFH